MKTLRPLVVAGLTCVLTTTSIFGQNFCSTEDESCCSAYMEGSRSAHWSVYIPIALIVGAAVWFGMADQSKKKQDSSDSQDGLGSIASSKRISGGNQHHYGKSRASHHAKNHHHTRALRSKSLPKTGYSH